MQRRGFIASLFALPIVPFVPRTLVDNEPIQNGDLITDLIDGSKIRSNTITWTKISADTITVTHIPAPGILA